MKICVVGCHCNITTILKILCCIVGQMTDIKYRVIVTLFHIVMYNGLHQLHTSVASSSKSYSDLAQAQDGSAYIHRYGLGHSFPKLSLFTY